jgi:hypothetical protein
LHQFPEPAAGGQLACRIELRLFGAARGVQNFYNVANRDDDPLIDSLAARGIAYVPYFPLGGFSPLQSDTLNSVANRLGAAPMAIALAWLLQRSPNILLIPGTASVTHLRENISAAALELPADAAAELDGIAHVSAAAACTTTGVDAGRFGRGALMSTWARTWSGGSGSTCAASASVVVGSTADPLRTASR